MGQFYSQNLMQLRTTRIEQFLSFYLQFIFMFKLDIHFQFPLGVIGDARQACFMHLLFFECLQNVKQLMSNYTELIARIFSHSSESQAEALRKLIYLSVNDQSKFSAYVPQIAKQLPQTLADMEDEQIKLLSLQLLSEMATNYTTKIPSQSYSFPQLVALLSDDNGEVRKASHYLILIFIKKYEQIDEVIDGYLQRIRQSPEHWKVLQKIIHSFQSLLVIQPKCITYSQDFSHIDDFMRMLLQNRNHHHSLIQKASQQTVNSFVKNQYVPQILPRLDNKIMKQLVDYAHRISVSLVPPKKSPSKDHNKEEDIEEIEIMPRKTSILQQLLLKLDSGADWKTKSEAIEQISSQLSNNNPQIPDDLVEKVLDLTYDYNFKTCITSMNVLLTIVTVYPTKISSRMRQIEDVIIDKVCDLKMAVRQLAHRILRNLYINHSKDFMKRLLTKLNNCSTVGKEEILNFLIQILPNNVITDLNLILSELSNQFQNQNTRVKMKAIECLVQITASNDVEQCKAILNRKLNKVYYDMFLERLSNKVGLEKTQNWDEMTILKKGMTWQAPQRPSTYEVSEKQASTKIEFGNNKKKFNETEQDFAFVSPGYKSNQKTNLMTTSTNSYKTSNTFISYNTFNSTDEVSVSSRKDKKLSDFGQPSFVSADHDQNFEEKDNQKRIPMKPTPIKKKTVIESQNDTSPLIVQSKQYQITKNDDFGIGESKDYWKGDENKGNERRESVEDKPKMKINRREKSNLKMKVEQEPKQKPLTSQPFSIKKSGSRKEHVIDYKATTYAAKDDLSALDNPKQTLKFILTNLPKDTDWNKQFEGLDFLRRIIKNHEDFYPTLIQNLPAIMPQVLKLVQSLRSSVSKNAMIALTEMCQALKKNMDAYVEPLFVKLFKKAQDANSFIVEEVRKCMKYLCLYCTTAKICAIIITNSNAKAIPIKVNVALCIDKILQKKQYDCQILKENIKIVSVMNNMIMDGSAEVRNSVKEILIQLLEYNNASEIEGLFKRNSSKDSWQKWKNIIDKEAALIRR